LGPDQQEIDTLVKRLEKTFKIEDQRELSDYLGIKMKGNQMEH
jgi:beta-xylosidase